MAIAKKVWAGYTGLGNHSFRVWKRKPDAARGIVELGEYNISRPNQPCSDLEFMSKLICYDSDDIKRRVECWINGDYHSALKLNEVTDG